MMRILVTGATGLVASYIVKKLSKNNNIWALSSRPEKLKEKIGNMENVNCYSNEAFLRGDLDNDEITVVIHCAFTRTQKGDEIASSLDFSLKVIEWAKKMKVQRFLYTSSRSVYLQPEKGKFNSENSAICCENALSTAKYAVELMVEEAFKGTETLYSNLRIASVNELKTEDNMTRPINVFVNNMIKGKAIEIVGGRQIMSYIAPQDVTVAVELLLQRNTLRPVYNVGGGKTCTRELLEIANLVNEIGYCKFNLGKVPIQIEKKEINQFAGLDSTALYEDTDWTAEYSIEKMIEDVFLMMMP